MPFRHIGYCSNQINAVAMCLAYSTVFFWDIGLYIILSKNVMTVRFLLMLMTDIIIHWGEMKESCKN